MKKGQMTLPPPKVLYKLLSERSDKLLNNVGPPSCDEPYEDNKFSCNISKGNYKHAQLDELKEAEDILRHVFETISIDVKARKLDNKIPYPYQMRVLERIKLFLYRKDNCE